MVCDSPDCMYTLSLRAKGTHIRQITKVQGATNSYVFVEKLAKTDCGI